MDSKTQIGLKDESIYPDQEVIKEISGDAFAVYQVLLERFSQQGMEYKWSYYNDVKSWLCKVQKKNRTIVWMSVWKDYVQPTIYFPDKHIDKLFELDLEQETMNRIRLTKNVGKSKPCIFQFRNLDGIGDFNKVMLLKLACK